VENRERRLIFLLELDGKQKARKLPENAGTIPETGKPQSQTTPTGKGTNSFVPMEPRQ